MGGLEGLRLYWTMHTEKILDYYIIDYHIVLK